MAQSPLLRDQSSRVKLAVVGVLMLLVYLAISWLSFACEQSDDEKTRPLLLVLSLFTVAGGGYLFACWQLIWNKAAQRTDGSGFEGLMIIVGFGVLFRLVLLFSIPIQEVDLYRYLWDGIVVSEGISPYEYSPQEVELVPSKGIPNYRTKSLEREDLERLARLATSPAVEKTFQGVHFEQYTTPYPLTNQLPFAIAATIGKRVGSYWGMLYAMKGVLILFDLATAFLLVMLLKRLCLPTDWVVAYLWCPLLLKEIANSGHLDSVAVFFNVAAVCLMVATYWRWGRTEQDEQGQGGTEPRVASSIIGSCFIAVLLGLAVGAKLFPIVLGPIWAVLMFKRMKFAAVVPLFVFAVVTAVLLWPMLRKAHFVHDAVEQARVTLARTFGDEDYQAAPLDRGPPAGIEAFVSRWEMNDFIFMLIIENLKPYGQTAQQYAQNNESTVSKVWFVKTSNQWRHEFADWYSEITGCQKFAGPFSFTRRLTLVMFTLIVVWTCARMWRHDHPVVLLELVFLSIAWFWFLAPTQNPWYWTWSLPWLMFCRNRIWYFVAPVAMAYYLRFYFEYHGAVDGGAPGLMGTPYGGTAFFDYIFPVLEFAPILLGLLITSTAAFWRQADRIGPDRSSEEAQSGL